MKKVLLSTLFASFGLYSAAQVPLNSVLEHFTNTRCGACAIRNPGLITNKDAHPSVNYLSIHPSSPYSGCILSIQNKTDNDNHTKFFGIFGGTPRIVINGNVVPGGDDYSSAAVYSPYTALTTPFSISITQTNIGTDSIRALVTIKKHAAHPHNGKLFIGAVEDTIFVDGGNGEKQHYNALRKSMTNASFENIALDFAIGDSVSITRTVAANAIWNMNRMFAMAILYDSTDNTVLQSEKTSPRPTTATSIAHSSPSIKFNIFPNPANSSLSILTENNDTYIGNIFSLLGNKISTFTFNNKVEIHTSAMPTGIYMLQLSNGAASTTQKIHIQH